MRTTVRLPDPLLEEAKAYAREHGKTLTDVLAEGLRTVLRKTGDASRRKQAAVELPVSKASGGLAPGVPKDAWTWSIGKWEEHFDRSGNDTR